jgi:two-component system, sensor histidine kinase and response regulator
MPAPSKILVVDDDQRNVRLMESILKTNGYPVIKAYDGQEALDLIASERPDLVLLDVMMPKMSGFEVCQRIRKDYETRLLPVIMVTALNALEEKVQALELGADDFLSKPINKVELLAKLRSMLRVKTLHDEVERTRRELESRNRDLLRVEELKDKLIQMVVHDLKNPLAGIMGNLQLLRIQGGPGDSGSLTGIVTRTEESAKQLMGLILNILDVARMEEGKLTLRSERLSPAGLVETCLRQVEGLATRTEVTVQPGVAPDLPDLCADAEILARVLGNLLNNALKHTPPGGRVEVGAARDGDEVRFWVRDSGEGIPPELLPRIFDKFVVGQGGPRGMHRPYGTGLGLTFCKMAVEAHGGRISAESQAGQGSTFTFALPLPGVMPAAVTSSPELESREGDY